MTLLLMTAGKQNASSMVILSSRFTLRDTLYVFIALDDKTQFCTVAFDLIL